MVVLVEARSISVGADGTLLTILNHEIKGGGIGLQDDDERTGAIVD
jgi:hypothetical protein